MKVSKLIKQSSDCSKKVSTAGLKNRIMFKFSCLCLLLPLLLMFLSACSNAAPPLNSYPNETVSDNEQGPDPDDTDDSDTMNQTYSLGLPGNRNERLSITFNDPSELELNPFRKSLGSQTLEVCDLIYDKLLYYNKSTFQYESRIIDNMSILDRTLTLALRNDVAFHNGPFLNTNDVLQTFELYQSAGHELGQMLEESVYSYLINNDYHMEIVLKDSGDAFVKFFNCMTKIPILPYQLWGARLPEDIKLNDLADLSSPSATGSGPYRVLREDDAALILESMDKAEANLPHYLVFYKYNQETLAQAALAHDDIDLLIKSVSSHPRETLIEELSSYADLAFWQKDDIDKVSVIPAREQRLGIALNPLSDQLENIYARKIVQALALRLETAQAAFYPEVENIPSLPAANQLTLPSVLPHTLTRSDYQLLPDSSDQAINEYLNESDWHRAKESRKILDSLDKEVELTFYYPAGNEIRSSVCRQIASILSNFGLSISAKEIETSEWHERLESKEYDLIYMESEADESLAQLSVRLRLFNGLEYESNVSDTDNYTAESGRRLLNNLRNDALAFKPLITNLQSLNVFLIENNLFIPLAITCESGGIINQSFFDPSVIGQLTS